MSRRTGLGRGLAALLPPTTRRDEPAPGTATHAPAVAGDEAVVGGGDRAAADGDDPARAVGAAPTPDDRTGDVSGETAGDGDGATASAGTPAASDRSPETPEVLHVPGPPATVDGEASDAPVAATTATYAEVPPSAIRPNPRQPRGVFDPDELAGLATSLRDVGVLQPLVVRPLDSGAYELIAGERRLRAATLAGLASVPVLVRHTDDADLLKEALVENIHRVQLNPLEEAAAYEQLLEEFGVTQEELAARLGRSRPAISNALRLLKLPPPVQRRVAAGVLSAGHAKVLAGIDDAAEQTRLAERIVAEGLSVRATEELVRLRALDASSRPTRRRPRTVAGPGILELQEDLSDALQARVRITMGARKGKLSIDVGSVDDLERIVAVIADGLGSQATRDPARAGANPVG